jgi:hypothetical protein
MFVTGMIEAPWRLHASDFFPASTFILRIREYEDILLI